MLSQGRRAFAPVLATIVLIAVTLISVISIGGFVFGLFGSYVAVPQVDVQSVSCSSTGNSCTMTLHNSGASDVGILTGASCTTLKYGGSTVSATNCSGSAGTTLPAGSSLTVTADFASSFAATAGEQFSGSVPLSNSAQIPFAGTFAQ